MADRNTKFEDLSLKQKVEHIWEYYKPVIFGIVAAIAVIVYIIVKIVTPEPDIIMNAVLINANTMEAPEEDTFVRYLQEYGYDTETETISVNASMYLDRENASQSSAASFQALVAMTMVGEIDLLLGDNTAIDMLGSGSGLMELEDILPPETLEKYKDRLYTVEDAETGALYVCGIQLPEGNPLQQDGYYGDYVLAAIPYTATHPDIAKEVLMYLLGE